MKRLKTYRYSGKYPLLIGMLLPLIVFLLLSCPVKRSLFSTFDGGTAPWEQNTETIGSLTTTASFHCGLTDTKHFQKSSIPSYLSHFRWNKGGLALFSEMDKPQSDRENEFTKPDFQRDRDPQVTLYLRNQSFLI